MNDARFFRIAFAALLLASCEASAASAFSRSTTDAGVPVHPRNEIAIDAATLSADEQKAVKRALATWLSSKCATLSAVKLVDGTKPEASTTIVVKRGVVTETFAAHTDTKTARDGTIESAVIVLDEKRAFTTTDDVAPNAFDLESVVLHELGHALGLAHPVALNVPHDVVMRAGTKPGKKLRALSDDDVAGLCAITAVLRSSNGDAPR